MGDRRESWDDEDVCLREVRRGEEGEKEDKSLLKKNEEEELMRSG